jgi:DNA-binding XRE family transcriptional regulator
MHALGFWTGTVAIENQLVKCTSDHLGDHIRVRRKSLNLKQVDVAKLIGVCEDTITGWENSRSHPQICHYPTIICFLGYNPFSFDTNTLGGYIKAYRIEKGISQEKLAEMISVDATTVLSWEQNKHKPSARQLSKLLLLGIAQK